MLVCKWREEGAAMASEAAKRAQVRYDKANTVQVHLKLNVKTDADIIGKLAATASKQGYIKQLIREDIAEA